MTMRERLDNFQNAVIALSIKLVHLYIHAAINGRPPSAVGALAVAEGAP